MRLRTLAFSVLMVFCVLIAVQLLVIMFRSIKQTSVATRIDGDEMTSSNTSNITSSASDSKAKMNEQEEDELSEEPNQENYTEQDIITEDKTNHLNHDENSSENLKNFNRPKNSKDFQNSNVKKAENSNTSNNDEEKLKNLNIDVNQEIQKIANLTLSTPLAVKPPLLNDREPGSINKGKSTSPFSTNSLSAITNDVAKAVKKNTNNKMTIKTDSSKGETKQPKQNNSGLDDLLDLKVQIPNQIGNEAKKDNSSQDLAIKNIEQQVIAQVNSIKNDLLSPDKKSVNLSNKSLGTMKILHSSVTAKPKSPNPKQPPPPLIVYPPIKPIYSATKPPPPNYYLNPYYVTTPGAPFGYSIIPTIPSHYIPIDYHAPNPNVKPVPFAPVEYDEYDYDDYKDDGGQPDQKTPYTEIRHHYHHFKPYANQPEKNDDSAHTDSNDSDDYENIFISEDFGQDQPHDSRDEYLRNEKNMYFFGPPLKFGVEDVIPSNKAEAEELKSIKKQRYGNQLNDHESYDAKDKNLNSGYHNSDHHNSGQHDSSHFNSDDHNSGHHDSGHQNSDDHDSDYYDTDHHNSGQHNSGQHNSGQHNSDHHDSNEHDSNNHEIGHHDSNEHDSNNHETGYHEMDHHEMDHHEMNHHEIDHDTEHHLEIPKVSFPTNFIKFELEDANDLQLSKDGKRKVFVHLHDHKHYHRHKHHGADHKKAALIA